MKNILIILISLLCVLQSFSQKCVEIVDPITNEKRAEFEYTTDYLPMGGLVHIKFEASKGQYTLAQEFTYVGQLDKNVPAGTDIHLKLENGNIITLKTSKETVPKFIATVSIWTRFNFIASISKEDLNRLASSPIVLVRIPKIIEEGYTDLNEKDKYIKKSKKSYMSGAECISKY